MRKASAYPKGLFTALPTPFKANGSVDAKSLSFQIARQKKARVEAVVLWSDAREEIELTFEEKKAVLEIALEACGKNLPLVVGTGRSSTLETIDKIAVYQNMGAAAALVSTPDHPLISQEGAYRHFSTIARATQCPMIVRNIPEKTGQELRVKTLFALGSIPEVLGIQEAPHSYVHLKERILQKMVSIFADHDTWIYSYILGGGVGAVSVAANLFPGEVARLIRAGFLDDRRGAKDAHDRLFPLFKALALASSSTIIQASMRYFSLPTGNYRPTAPRLAGAQLRFLHKQLKKMEAFWEG